jgi:hypothetical protein
MRFTLTHFLQFRGLDIYSKQAVGRSIRTNPLLVARLLLQHGVLLLATHFPSFEAYKNWGFMEQGYATLILACLYLFRSYETLYCFSSGRRLSRCCRSVSISSHWLWSYN